MVDVAGHLGMAMIWLAPAWFLLTRTKTAVTFVGTGFWFGMLPDVDLLLSNWFPQSIHHHGVFHTILVVTILAAVIGPILGWILKAALEDTDWLSPQAASNYLSFGVLAVWIAGLSHLFADMLSAPDASTPIEPFWPLFHGGLFHVDVLYYKSFWATWALLILGLAVNGALWAWKSRE
jgi:hypothetical protein